MYIANTISSIKQLEFNSEVEKSCVIRAYTYEENPTLTLTPHKKKTENGTDETFVGCRSVMYFGKMLLPLELKMIKKLKFPCDCVIKII